jgi:hypothetical protein
MKDATTPINSPSFFDATRFDIGGDACQQIAFTFNDPSFPVTGGTVDARGLTTGTPLTCSVNPIPSGKTGRLLLGTGIYLAQVPWVIQNSSVNIIGTGGGTSNGTDNTVIQACKTAQTGCAAAFPSGRAVIEIGPTLGGGNVYQVTVKELGVDCQDAPGVSGFAAIAAQEETVLDLVKASGCRVAGFDLGVGDTAIQNGAALSNFNVTYPSNGSGGGYGCPTPTAGVISSSSRDSSGVVTATLSSSPSPALVVGNEIVITGGTVQSFRGTYRVNSVTNTTPITFTYLQHATGG